MIGDKGFKIDISPIGEVSILFKNDDGTTSSKKVSLSDLCTSLSKGVVKTIEIVPNNCRVIAKNDNLNYYLFTYAPAIRDIFVTWTRDISNAFGMFEECMITPEEGDKFIDYRREYIRKFKIPYPGLAYIVKVRKNALNEYTLANAYAFAIKNVCMPIDKIKAYRWPFTNIYSDGRCCLGGHYNDYNTSSIDGIEGMSSLLFYGLGNTDLTNSISRPTDWEEYSERAHFALPEHGSLGRIWNEHQFISKLHGLQNFPYEYLKPYSDNLYSLFSNI